MIELKSSEEIEKMLASGKIVSKVLKTMQEEAVAGVSTWRLDQIAEEIIRSAGAVPSFLGYAGYPASICASINEEVVHGIPSKERILKEGDIIGIDVGAYLNGFHADAALTVPVGKVSGEAKRLLGTTKKALHKAVNASAASLWLYGLKSSSGFSVPSMNLTKTSFSMFPFVMK